MRYFKIGFVVYFLISLYVNVSAFSFEISSDEVCRIAEKEKNRFFGLIGLEYLMKYGKADLEKKPPHTLQDAMNGIPYGGTEDSDVLMAESPFRVHTVNIGEFMKSGKEKKFSDFVIQTDEWLVPLNIHGKAHACIKVGFLDGKWQAVGISLGKFGEYIKNMPGGIRPGKPGRKFIRIYPVADFIAVEDGKGNTKCKVLEYSDVFDQNQKDAEGFYRTSYIIPEIAGKIRTASVNNN
jgi:hypothetical protein